MQQTQTSDVGEGCNGVDRSLDLLACLALYPPAVDQERRASRGGQGSGWKANTSASSVLRQCEKNTQTRHVLSFIARELGMELETELEGRGASFSGVVA